MKMTYKSAVILTAICVLSACSTTKKKDEIKGISKLYQNTTARFNGFFNAEELMTASVLALEDMHEDNYNQVLDVYEYVDVDNPKTVSADLDKAIEKVSRVATLHPYSNYVDDCYVLIGKAQYLKQDYEAAEETFRYFDEEFNPKNPFGRVYKRADNSKSRGDRKKELKQNQKERKKELEAEKKAKEEERKAKEKERKAIQEQREKERKEKEKARKKAAKERKNKGRSRTGSRKTRDSQKSDKNEEQAVPAIDTTAKTPILAEQTGKVIDEKVADTEEKKEKKEEEPLIPTGKGGNFKNKSAYNEGLIWLARTAIERDDYASAESILNRLDNSPGINKDLTQQLAEARAHLYIKKNDYAQALAALDRAYDAIKNRQKRARYSFIKGQIAEKLGNAQKAYAEYQKAKKLSPDYEMQFNASLNEVKLSYKTGKTSRANVLDKLEGYFSESKNAPFADQIYFTMAEVKLEAGDIDEAMADFKRSIDAAGGKQNVKLESYYRLASLLFDREEYAQAKTNYDEALKLMKKTDPRFRETERLANNLTDIAKNIDIVNLQDSLLKLSVMSEDDLRTVALQILESQPEVENKTAAKKDEQSRNLIGSNRQLGAGRSNFFAYNPLAMNQGKADFRRRWGDRSLEDDWRRSIRVNASRGIEDIAEEEEEETVFSDEDIQRVLRGVPRNESQVFSSNTKIQNALFELGILFRERLKNYEKSADALERLISEYPDFDRRDQALFYLYLSQDDLGNSTRVAQIKQMMLSEFPNSKYTLLATDPAYAQSLLDEEATLVSYYDDTYDHFDRREFDEVIRRVEEKDELFPDDESLAAKFALLNAMAIGSTQGEPEYIKALEQLTKRYPNTPEDVRAKEILRFLRGDQDAFDNILYDEAVQAFVEEDKKLHYIFLIVYDLSQRQIDNTKIDISNYNKKYHRFDNLKVSNIFLNRDNKSQAILIRSFDDKAKAMKYYNDAIKNKDEFITSGIPYDIYAGTQRNYREVIKQRTASQYRVFFEQKYLNSK